MTDDELRPEYDLKTLHPRTPAERWPDALREAVERLDKWLVGNHDISYASHIDGDVQMVLAALRRADPDQNQRLLVNAGKELLDLRDQRDLLQRELTAATTQRHTVLDERELEWRRVTQETARDHAQTVIALEVELKDAKAMWAAYEANADGCRKHVVTVEAELKKTEDALSRVMASASAAEEELNKWRGHRGLLITHGLTPPS